jgi:hypothetical protein
MSYLPDPIGKHDRPGRTYTSLKTETAKRNFTMPHQLLQQVKDIGALRGVIYSRGHGSNYRTFVHFMEDPPRLQCSTNGRQLFICGGSYQVTPRGIEG